MENFQGFSTKFSPKFSTPLLFNSFWGKLFHIFHRVFHKMRFFTKVFHTCGKVCGKVGRVFHINCGKLLGRAACGSLRLLAPRISIIPHPSHFVKGFCENFLKNFFSQNCARYTKTNLSRGFAKIFKKFFDGEISGRFLCRLHKSKSML